MRRKSKPHHPDKDYNLHLSSIMKSPKYSPSPSITEAKLRNLLEVSDLSTFCLTSSLLPYFGAESLHGSSESERRHIVMDNSNSLTSASSLDINGYQDWLPKGVGFCHTVELYLYKQ